MSKSEGFWDRTAESFRDHDQTTRLDDNKDFITTLKYLRSTDTVLDYGCATGIISNAIADKVKTIHAIDISSKMIDIAREKAAERSISNVHYARGTIFDETLIPGSFDVILAFRIFHVLEDLPAVIRRFNALLKPGGVCISVSTCMSSVWSLFGILSFLPAKLGMIPPVGTFSLARLQKYMTDAGFELLEHEKMDDRVPTYCVVARRL